MTSEVEEEIRLLGGGVSEPLVIQELLERLRDLEAENTTLAQANETQRETYERCLDEVANHVVQALLNQKDLREECIKLKKRVFDLERQNRALSDLFHQKLQRSSGSSPEALSDSHGGDLDRISVSVPIGQCGMQREEKPRPSRAQSSCRSLDAMSPFLRKKAQILEVLRRLEATGSQSGSSCTAPPMFLGGISSASGNGLRVRPDQGLDYVNGEGLIPSEHGGDEPWASCLLLAQNGWEELLKWKPIQREPPAGSPGEGGGEHLGLASGEDVQQSSRQAEGSSSSSDDDIGDPLPPPSEIRQRLPLTDLTKGIAPCMCSRGAVDKRSPIEGHSDGTGFSRGHTGHLHSLTCYSRSLRDMVESQHVPVTPPPAVTERGDSLSSSPGKQSVSENGSDAPSSCPPSPSSVSLPRDATVFSHKSAAQEQQDDCPQPLMVVPNPPCPDPQDALIPSSEPRTPHIPSPAKFLKFLKLPGSGEKLQNPNSLRLSPQLTQTSKIPCRSNNYEAFPSPRLNRKAAEELPGPETDDNPSSPSEFINSNASRQGQTERSNNLLNRPGIQCYTKKSHDYENVPAKNTVLPTASQAEDLELSPKLVGEVCPFNCSPGSCVHSQVNSSNDPNSQMNTPFIRKHVTSRKPTESAGPHPFKERIVKLRGSDNPQTEPAVTGTDENRVITDLRPSMKRALGVSSLRTPEPGSTESYPPRYLGQKSSDSARTRQPATNCPPGSPHGPRTPSRAPPVPSKSPRSPHGSPTKLPAKSPSKATAKPLVSRPLSEELRPSPRQPTLPNDEKQRMHPSGAGKKSGTCQEYACPRSPGPPGTENLPLSALHSAIEEKVMKGIKENMLRLQEQHRAPAPDPKQRNSSGIASWFGLKKSKLPALSRRPETTRVKDDKRERSSSGSPRTRDTKGESLNISMLMEKAEDLRKALQEERAYINGLSLDKNRMAVSVDQTREPSRPLTADNFMQQLLNRVDGKEVPVEGRLEGKTPLRDFPRLSPENKEVRPFRPPRNGMVAAHVQRCEQKNMEQNREVVLPPDEQIAESLTSQHFAACDSLTRTLDSGIGTFPPPDYCGGTPNKNTPKLKPRLDSPSVLPVGRFSAFPKAPRRARTLERDIRGVEEMFPSGQHQSVPAFHALLAEPEPAISHRMYGEDSNRDRSLPQQGKNWTFPNAKVSASSTETFRTRAHELEEYVAVNKEEVTQHASRTCTEWKRPIIPSEGDRDCDMSGYPHPSLCFPGSVSSRTPSTSEVGDEGTSEAKSRDNEQGQTGLENSESLSDSLYDSLSSCGSQG